MRHINDALKISVLRYGLFILLITAIYASTINNGFVWDDNNVIVHNPLLGKLGNIPHFFLSEDMAMGYTGYYRPVTYISFALDRALWGLNPAGFHLTNITLHLFVVLLFYMVVMALFKKERLAFVATLLFALHPVTAESVNFLAGGRNTLLSACFGLLSLLLYIKKKQIPAAVCFTAAIFSKEFALLLPIIFLLYDFRLNQEKKRFSGYILYLIPIVSYLALRSYAVQKANFISAINLSDSLAAPYLIVRYVLNMLYPFHLKILYDALPNLLLSMVCLFVLAGLVTAVRLFRKNDEILFSAAWLFLFLLPVINIIPLDSASLMADRYAYFSLMGFALFLASVVCKLNGRALAVCVGTICIVYSLIDFGRGGIWENEIVFFTRMTTDAPEKFDGFQNLGMLHYKNGDIARAVPFLAAALTKPDISAQFLIGSASVFWKENMRYETEKSLLRAISLGPTNPEPYLMLIKLYEQSGSNRQAALYREKGERLFRGMDTRMAQRAVALCREGDGYLAQKLYVPAENVFWQALQINPEYAPALAGMGRVKDESGF